MAKGDLFCIRTNIGYGLFQEFDCYPHNYGPFYIVYYTQIKQLCESDIFAATSNDFYYARIGFGTWDGRFSKKKILSNKYKQFGAEDFGIDVSDPYYGACYITYLGNYDCAENAEIPKYSRELDISYFTGKHKWYIQDEVNADSVMNEKGRIVSYGRATDEIAEYPDSLNVPPREILNRFNANYRQSDGDRWAEKKLEEYYKDNPHMRPTDTKFDDIKRPYPTERWSKDAEDMSYRDFVDSVEGALDRFVESVENNTKAVQKPLSKLISDLNKIEKETGFIGTTEAEDLYGYIVKVLRSLRKPRLTELLESRRAW